MKIELKNLYGEKKPFDLNGFWLGKGFCMLDHSTFLIAENTREMKERFKGGFGYYNNGFLKWFDNQPFDIEICFKKVDKGIYEKYKNLHGEDINSELEFKLFGI